MPRVHQLSRRIYFQKLAFEDIWASTGHPGGAPAPTHTHIARPLPRIKHTWPDPPRRDLLRGERLENPLRRGRDLHAGQNRTLTEIGHRAGNTRDRPHFPSRL